MSQSAKLNLTFLVTVLITLAASFLLGLLPEGVELPLYISLLLSELLLLAPAWYFVKKNGKNIRQMIPQRRLSLGTVACLIGFTVAVQPLVAFINYISSFFFGNAVTALSGDLISMPTAVNVLLIAVLPAFCEEVVFRGIYFNGYRKHGFWKAMLVSGLFFGLLHMNWNQFSYGFVLGMIFAVLMEAVGSIYAPMLVHFGINFQSVMALSAYHTLEEYTGELQQEENMLYGSGAGMAVLQGSYLLLAAAVSIGFCLLLMYVLARINHRADYMRWILWGQEAAQLKTMPRERLLDGAMAAAILICVGFMCYFQLR